MSGQARRIAKSLAPAGGWFHDPGTTGDLTDTAQRLLDAGVAPEVITDVLNVVINAISNEYGA